MAEMRLQFILDATDRTKAAIASVQRNLDGIQKRIKSMKPIFQKMALYGSIGFGAISLASGSAIKSAMKAEGAYNKFNTVFGEHKDDMIEFVKDLRTKMPSATHEIVIMASGLQDLLVPMGIAREEATGMTQNFLDLANKVAAFNDVPVVEVLNAIKSGLVGSSEPLRRYGVDTRIVTLEATAFTEGLIKEGETFAKLTPAVRAQVTAQALLIQITNQSSDAIEGFEVNQDSALRRTEELQASIVDASVAIGNALLPLYDTILKKMLPIVEKIGDWIKLNPKLTKIIIIATGAFFGVVAVLGLLGIILPVIIILVGALTAISLPWIAIILVIIATIGVFVAIGWTLYKNWEEIKIGMGIMWNEMVQKIKDSLAKIKNTFIVVWTAVAGFFSKIWHGIGNVVITVFEGIKNTIKSSINWIIDKINWFIRQANKVTSIIPGAPIITEIARLAKGGIVTKPTLAMIGEEGPEAVIPLRGGFAGAGIGGITININGGMYLSEDAAEEFGELLADELKRNIKI